MSEKAPCRTADEEDVLARIRRGIEQAMNGMGRAAEDVFDDLESEAASPGSTP